MRKVWLLALIISIVQVSHGNPLKMKVIWLNNGGNTISWWQDWITVIFSTPNLNVDITCPEGYGYTYYSGTTKRFDNLWFPVETTLLITLIQYNIWSPNDVTHAYLEQIGPVGYYHF